jgi:hydrogenase/urease accessory protein HupE
MNKMTLLGPGTAIAAALLSLPAAAHPGHGEDAGLAFSILHPMGDLENLFLMIVIGVVALALVKATRAGP